MPRAIMLLPSPDNLQLANCHKYVTRQDDKRYEEIYTLKTIAGKCAKVDKILVIGHGDKGKFEGATVDQVVQAIIGSGISLTGNKKVGFDTCYAGYSDTNVASALDKVKDQLLAHDKQCNLELVGATGCSVTIGPLGNSAVLPLVGGVDLSWSGGTPAKRLVIKDDKTDHAGDLQNKKIKDYKVDLFGHRPDWDEGAPSQQIKVWAQAEYSKLISFAIDFRSNLGPDLETSVGRKVKLKLP
jgi:hypothetical protein